MGNPAKYKALIESAIQGMAQIAAANAEATAQSMASGAPQSAGALAQAMYAQAAEGLAQLAQNPYQDDRQPQRHEPTLAIPGTDGDYGYSLHVARNCLNGGELSPEMAARFDQQRHASGCRSLVNMIPLPCGGITKRPGFRHLAYAAARGAGKICKLIDFVFSASASRVLELAEEGAKCSLRVFSPEGTLLHSQSLPIPPAALKNLSWAQSADVIFIANQALPPGKIMRYADDDWRYETINWLPAIEAPSIAACFAMGPEPQNENRRVTLEYVVTAIDKDTGEESAPSASYTLSGQYPLSESRFARLTIGEVANAAEYYIYKKNAGVFGFIGRTASPEPGTDPAGTHFDDTNIAPDTEDTPPEAKNPFAGPENYPAAVFLHQQRLGYAASKAKPLTIWMSQAGNFESMAASVPPEADDAIEVSLAAAQANRILWAVSDRSGLLVGTEGGEWLLAPAEGAALTPSDLSFQPQTSLGSQPGLQPARVGGGVVFAQRGGRVARSLGYSFQDDRYNATDLSVLSRHILRDSPIVAWVWQQEPYGILWMALANGKMAALTFLPEHEVIAWHRHETGGRVEDLCAIPADNGDFAVFALISRNGSRRIELLQPFGTDNENSRHVDGADETAFTARCIPCLPEQNLQTGSTWLMIRKINAIKAQVLNSKPFCCRILS
ncbi:MAG: hypothetical protein NC489_45505, partial [Ruminococcus flavefaciens]|nr:hypothetical protein [Ruminococcus flavefaciens]